MTKWSSTLFWIRHTAVDDRNNGMVLEEVPANYAIVTIVTIESANSAVVYN